MIFRSYFVWKVKRCPRSSFIIRQHSEPYSSVERTQLWYSLNFVLLEYIVDLSLKKAALALFMRFLMSTSALPSLHSVTDLAPSPWPHHLGPITLDFFLFIFSPNF